MAIQNILLGITLIEKLMKLLSKLKRKKKDDKDEKIPSDSNAHNSMPHDNNLR